VEQRFRILACSKQRHHAHGGVEFYDLSLLDNLSTYAISDPFQNPFRLERFRIVFGDDWVYSGDINLAKEPNGYGHMELSQGRTMKGFFRNGTFVKECNERDDDIAATRLLNTIFMSLEFLNCGPNSTLVAGSNIDVMREFDSALSALTQMVGPTFLEHVSHAAISSIEDSILKLPRRRLSMFKTSATKSLTQLRQKIDVFFSNEDMADHCNLGIDEVSPHVASSASASTPAAASRNRSPPPSSTPVSKEHADAVAQSAAAAAAAVVQQPLSAARTSASQALADHNFCGMINPGVLCCFISLLQSWFYIKAFRNVVLNSKSQDTTITQLNCVFRSLQNRNIGSRTDCMIKVLFLEFSIWFLCPTHIISELRFEVSMFR
jgi:hypothetical protein